MTIDANWYVDPNQPGQGRYWDGTQWTEHVTDIQPGAVFAVFPSAPAPQAAPAPPPPPPPDPSGWPQAAPTIPPLSEAPTGAKSLGPTVAIGGKQIPMLLLGGAVAVVIVAIVLIAAASGGSSGNYSNAKDIASAISGAGAGCTSPDVHTEAGVADVVDCRVDDASVEIAFLQARSGGVNTALAEARVATCGIDSSIQVYYISADQWEVSSDSQAAMKKVQGAIGGTLKSLC